MAGFFLPTLTLVPLGSLWLWQRGYLLYWAIATTLCVAIAAYIQRRMFHSVTQTPSAASTGEKMEALDGADADWSPAEREAWAAVLALAKRTDADAIASRDAAIELGLQTVRAVALRLHPEVNEPLWQFTVPEALALCERVSRRLKRYAMENVPLGDKLTVAQMLAVYRWRGAIDVAERVYDVWRLVRMANPLTAATHELRERLSKQMFDWGRAHVTDRLIETYVKEVGRAAIDLYGGRLRVSANAVSAVGGTELNTTPTAPDGADDEPLKVMIAGRVGSGKTSMVSALADQFGASVSVLSSTPTQTYRFKGANDIANVLAIEAFPLSEAEPVTKMIKQAVDCDLFIIVIAAHRRDVDIEQRASVAFNRRFARLPRRKMPPILIVLTHIDLLAPVEDWSPPYDLDHPTVAKAEAIKDAVDAVAARFLVPNAAIVAVSNGAAANFNVDQFGSKVRACLPEAQRARLSRLLAQGRGMSLRTIWSQAAGASRLIGGVLRR